MATNSDEPNPGETNTEATDGALDELMSRAVDARRAPTETADVLLGAFTWRTIDAELMQLSYDSAGDLETVRDADAPQTLEFTAGETSLIVEVAANGTVRGQVFADETAAAIVTLRGVESVQEVPLDEFGGFEFTSVPRGQYRVELSPFGVCSAAFLVD